MKISLLIALLLPLMGCAHNVVFSVTDCDGIVQDSFNMSVPKSNELTELKTEHLNKQQVQIHLYRIEKRNDTYVLGIRINITYGDKPSETTEIIVELKENELIYILNTCAQNENGYQYSVTMIDSLVF